METSKVCRYCGLPMARKKGEPPSTYAKRLYHNRACAFKGKTLQNDEKRAKQQPAGGNRVSPFAVSFEPLILAPFAPPSPLIIQVPEPIREAVIKAVGIRNMRGAVI